MRKLALLILVAALGLPAAASAQGCPFTRMSTQDFGMGCGPGGASQLVLGLDPVNCEVALKIDPALCCNFAALDHWVAYGAQLGSPINLPPPYFAGCQQFIAPFRVFGPLPGLTSSHPVPPDPNLIGRPFGVQAVVRYSDTISGAVSLGSTQGVLMTLF